MKRLIRHALIFGAAFFLAGSAAFYGVRLFTRSAAEVMVPGFKEKNVIYVLETLTNMGLNAKLGSTRYHESIPRFSVIGQSPEPGTTIKKGRDVVIHLSRGKKTSLVPDLKSVRLDDARMLLEKHGLALGQTSRVYSSRPRDQVIAQTLPAFSTAFKKSACDLLVSRGPRPRALVMPVLTGLSLSEAATRIHALSLELGQISSRTNPARKAGTILGQAPGPGSRIFLNARVTLEVNADLKDRVMAPGLVNRMILVTHPIQLGLLNTHVQVQTDLFGGRTALYNEHVKPGTVLRMLVPADQNTRLDIWIDHQLVRIIHSDPWKRDHITGDKKWESLPPQSFQQILHSLDMN